MEEKIAIAIAVFNTLILYLLTDDKETLLIMIVYHIVFPLPLIIFNEELGSLTGITFMRPGPIVNKPSHPTILKIIGWILLLIPLLISFIGLVKIVF